MYVSGHAPHWFEALEVHPAGRLEDAPLGLRGNDLPERTIADPPDKKARPEALYTAQFSGPFTFAVAMRGGGGLGVYLDDFTEETVCDENLARELLPQTMME